MSGGQSEACPPRSYRVGTARRTRLCPPYEVARFEIPNRFTGSHLEERFHENLSVPYDGLLRNHHRTAPDGFRCAQPILHSAGYDPNFGNDRLAAGSQDLDTRQRLALQPFEKRTAGGGYVGKTCGDASGIQ